MKITNKLNLPQAFVSAVTTEKHNAPGTFSATTLNKGTKEIILAERHWDEMTDDAADRVWATFGTAVHALLETQPDNCFHEERFQVPVSESAVTGCVDSYDMESATINDWKTAPVWKVKMGDFSDWYNQGMTYAWILKKNGLEVRHCRFIALLKDHSKSKAKTESGYPESPVFIYQFDITEEELAQAGIRIQQKVMELEDARFLSDDEIKECSSEERWADPAVFAVMKKGRKSAVKLHSSETDAQAHAESLGADHYVEYRPGVDRKCEGYCSCKDFCSYYKRTHEVT